MYSQHAEALKIVGIAAKEFLTFKELEKLQELKSKEEKEIEKEKKRKRRKRYILLHWCKPMFTADAKHPPMHAIIKKARDKHRLQWF